MTNFDDGPPQTPSQAEPALVHELVSAWAELLAINPHVRDRGGKANRRVWAAIDALAENRS